MIYICKVKQKLSNKQQNMEENLPKIRPMLRNLAVGESVAFPLAKMKSVRTQATELSIIENLKFKTRTDRNTKQITVWREA
jgi:hypothetical protein